MKTKIPYTNRQIAILLTIKDDYKSIENETSLANRKLTFNDLKIMGNLIKTLENQKVCFTKSKTLAEYFSGFGLCVNNYWIEL